MELFAILFIAMAALHCASAVSPEDKQLILDVHNELRGKAVPAATNMIKLYWNESLAHAAELFLETCPQKAHDPGDLRVERVNLGPISVGQNMAGRPGVIDFEREIRGWHTEISRWNYGIGPNGNGGIGHFIQVMLARVTHVGCAVKECRGSNRYICNYANGWGTWDYTQPWKNGTACSDCGGTCTDNLCDCGDLLCENGGELDSKTCTCQCPNPSPYYGITCHEKDCSVEDWHVCGPDPPEGWGSNCRKDYMQEHCPHMCGIC